MDQPFNVTEKVGFEQFLIDHHPKDDVITVPSNWLQQQLRELEKLKRQVAQQQRQATADKEYMLVLRNQIDNLLLASQIRNTSYRVQKYLDVHS